MGTHGVARGGGQTAILAVLVAHVKFSDVRAVAQASAVTVAVCRGLAVEKVEAVEKAEVAKGAGACAC